MFIVYAFVIALSCALLSVLAGRFYYRLIPQVLDQVPSPFPAHAMTGCMVAMFLLVLGMNAYVMLGLIVLWVAGLRHDFFAISPGATLLIALGVALLAGLSFVVHPPATVPFGLPLPVLMLMVTGAVCAVVLAASPLAKTSGVALMPLALCSVALVAAPLVLPEISSHIAMEGAVLLAASLIAMRTRQNQCVGYACVWPLVYGLAYAGAQLAMQLGSANV